VSRPRMPHPPPPPASAALAWLGCPHPPFLQLLVFALPPTACMHATRAGLCGAAVQLQPAWLPAAAVLGAAAHGGHALPASCSGAPDADHKRGKPHAGGAPFGGVAAHVDQPADARLLCCHGMQTRVICQGTLDPLDHSRHACARRCCLRCSWTAGTRCCWRSTAIQSSQVRPAVPTCCCIPRVCFAVRPAAAAAAAAASFLF
jgi:hypothetical protein